MNFLLRHSGIIFTATCAAILATVYISQYVFNMAPCHLCQLQRIPYFIALGLSILLIAYPQNKIITALLAITFLSSLWLAIFHVGVEYKWWPYNSGCTGSAIKAGASVEDMLAALKKAPVARCDEPVSFLFGMSMAFYNVLVSAGLMVLAVLSFSSRSESRG